MKKIAVAVIALVLININSFAQCSDAGVCSIGGHSMEESTTAFNLSLGYSYGYSGKEDDVTYSSVKLSGAYHFFDDTQLNIVMPYNFQSGPLGSLNGIGDLILSLSHGFKINESMLTLSTGMKFSTSQNDANFPQTYQNGFGSNDILFGADFSYSNFTLGIGYQISGGENDYGLRLNRGDDLLVRAGYLFSFNKISINPQILFIKRLGKSTVYFSDLISQITYQRVEVENSDQSQINLLVNTTYEVSDGYALFLEAALPFLERDVNVDGLKRTFSISSGISFRF